MLNPQCGRTAVDAAISILRIQGRLTSQRMGRYSVYTIDGMKTAEPLVAPDRPAGSVASAVRKLLAAGHTVDEIAAACHTKRRTVLRYRQQMCKMGMIDPLPQVQRTRWRYKNHRSEEPATIEQLYGDLASDVKLLQTRGYIVFTSEDDDGLIVVGNRKLTKDGVRAIADRIRRLSQPPAAFPMHVAG